MKHNEIPFARCNDMNNLTGLTMDLSRVTMPVRPVFVPQVVPSNHQQLSSFMGQDTVSTASQIGENISAEFTLCNDTPMLTIPPMDSTANIRSNNRPRYVLPPGICTTSLNTSVNPSELAVTPSVPKCEGVSNFIPRMNVHCPDNYPSTYFQSEVPYITKEPVVSTTGTESLCDRPPNAYWFYSTIVNGNSVWWPFNKRDSYKLELEVSRTHSSSSTFDDLLISSSDNQVVQTEGGRYDVSVPKRQRRSVYWDEPLNDVRRSTWFYKPQNDSRILPFPEHTCDRLEAQYKLAIEQNKWGHKFELPSEDNRGGNDVFIFHSSESMVQYLAWPCNQTSAHSNLRSTSACPPIWEFDYNQSSINDGLVETEFSGLTCQIRRGLDEKLLAHLDDGDDRPIDHLFFIIHGIGSIYNLKGEGLIECVSDMRRIAKEISHIHFPQNGCRAEFLPILWHDELHSDTATGIDKQLKQITLGSIPKLRQFTNNTLMDILFYTSPKYSQIIVNTVAREIQRLHNLFISRNPDFQGNISLIGHSLGAVIAFDLLAHQQTSLGNQFEKFVSNFYPTATGNVDRTDKSSRINQISVFSEDVAEESEEANISVVHSDSESWPLSGYQHSQQNQRLRQISSDLVPDLVDMLNKIGLNTVQTDTIVNFWHQNIKTITPSRSEQVSTDPGSSNFWLLDETFMLNQSNTGVGLPLIAYPQLTFNISCLYALGSPIALFLTARGLRSLPASFRLPNCVGFFNIFHPYDPVAYRMETLIDPHYTPKALLIPHHKGRKRLHLQLKDNLARVGIELKSKFYSSVQSTWRSLHEFALSHRLINNGEAFTGDTYSGYSSSSEFLATGSKTHSDDQVDTNVLSADEDCNFESELNGGRRIDYVLQEAPLESFNEYIFALTSHGAYWESEDTILFIMSQAYSNKATTPVSPCENALNDSSTQVHLLPTPLKANTPQETLQNIIQMPTNLSFSTFTNTTTTQVHCLLNDLPTEVKHHGADSTTREQTLTPHSDTIIPGPKSDASSLLQRTINMNHYSVSVGNVMLKDARHPYQVQSPYRMPSGYGSLTYPNNGTLNINTVRTSVASPYTQSH